ncbi:MAG: hypothetical protein LBE35_02085 [Clostridiales bacterium]|jgi:hypothetical protein|nr:hypothetical protein [Clostridiales bacterium]
MTDKEKFEKYLAEIEAKPKDPRRFREERFTWTAEEFEQALKNGDETKKTR